MLAVVAAVAGFLDTLAGGGGLLVIPALLLAGLSPIQAIATNKLQGSFGTLVAATTMLRRGIVHFNDIRSGFILALVGAVAGALLIQRLPDRLVDVVTPTVLLLIAAYFLLNHRVGESDQPPKISNTTYAMLVAPGIGFYDGAFGPGAGSFYTLSGSALLGKNLVSATARAKLLNFASNIAALAVFAGNGKVLWVTGMVMLFGTMLGAYLGSLAVLYRGARLIRPMIVIMSLVMLSAFILKSF